MSRLQARDVMSSEPICIEASCPEREVVQAFNDYRISGLPVVDEVGRLVGLVTRTSVVRRGQLLGGSDAFGSSGDDFILTARDIMCEEPATASPETPVHEIAARLVDASIHRVVVVDRERVPVGIVTTLDILRHWPT